MSGKRILVTGDRGYIGSVLVPMLIESGHHVDGLDSRLFDGANFYPFKCEAYSHIKDIRDVTQKDFEGYDIVIHLAALSNDPLGDINPELTFQINYKATLRVAEMAKRAGVQRFVMSSSCSTYGAAGEDVIDETSTLAPVTPYAESKVRSEEGLALMAGPDFVPVFLRHATVYGVAPMIRFDLVINNMVAYLSSTGEVYMKSDGRAWRPLVHVEDVARGCISAALAPYEAVCNEVFNIGRTDQNFRVHEIAELVALSLEGAGVRFADRAFPDERSYRVCFDKAEKRLPGFKPVWTVQKGIAELWEAFTQLELSIEQFEGSQWNRIAHLKERLAHGELTKQLRQAA